MTDFNSEYCATNTVDFKAINQYSRNVNTLAKLSFDNSPAWRSLQSFIKGYRVKSGMGKSNITAPGGSYKLEGFQDYEQLFMHLQECHKDNLTLHFRELQIGDKAGDLESQTGSGIMIDFDILHTEAKSCRDVLNMHMVAQHISRVLMSMLDTSTMGEDEKIYMAFIVKPEPVYKESAKMYKDGFHVLIPSVKLARVQKKMFLERLLVDQALNKVFLNSYEHKVSLKDALDMQCASVPVFFLHNCKESSSAPYQLYAVMEICEMSNFSPCALVDNVMKPEVYNWIKELSLVHDGMLVRKRFYNFKADLQEQALSRSSKVNPREVEMEESIHTFNTFNSYVEDNLDYYRKLALEILDVKRAEDRCMWRNVVFAIANINHGLRPGLKEVARQFSMRCESKYNSEEFDKLWKEACGGAKENKLSYRSLVYWCKADNPELFNEIRDFDIKQTIERDVFHRENKLLNGSLFQYHFAYYMHHLFNQKFAYDVDNTGKIYQWYEFVLETDPHSPGELYKWRAESRPESLMLYMSNKFPDIINAVINKAEARIKTEKDEALVEYISKRLSELVKSSKGLYRNDFKFGVVKECEALFRRRGFMDSVDQDPEVMGVGNGVLEFKNKPSFSARLITGYHEYRITIGTTVKYYPYNPNSPHVRRMWKIITDMFPDSERDAMHKLLYMFSSALDGHPKDSELYQLVGGGSNGKSSLLEMIKTVLGKYGGKLSMAMLTTDGRNNAASANESLMMLRYARLAFYSETNKAEVLNTAVVKELTSQETITGRGIYQKQQQFRPNCLHVITTNCPMTIKTTDHGTWRRMNLYTHKIKFVANPDPESPYERMMDESVAKEMAFSDELKEAMLSILVEYYKDLQVQHKGSLSSIPSPSIQRETQQYRYDQDILNRFICDMLVYNPDSTIVIQDLCDAFEKWVEINVGKSAVPDRKDSYSQMLSSVLVKFVHKTNTKVLLRGIRILDMNMLDDQLIEKEMFLRDKLKLNFSATDMTDYDESRYNPCKI
jgi:phage/plasmid-associated DNA primase